MKVLILNNTEREVGHLGCTKVMNNLCSILYSKGIKEIIAEKEIWQGYDKMAFYQLLENIDFVIVNGEGTLHHGGGMGLYERCSQARDKGKKIYLINAVWQDNGAVSKHLDLFNLIYVRESFSLQQIIQDGRPDAKVVPDLSFYGLEKKYEKSDMEIVFVDSVLIQVSKRLAKTSFAYKARFLFMGDWARNLFINRLPHYYLYGLTQAFHNMRTLKSVNEIGRASVLVTGRFHAACLSIKCGTPFLAISSNTHKIEGLLYDMGLESEKHILKMSEFNVLDEKIAILNSSRPAYIEKSEIFVLAAQSKIDEMFETIIKDYRTNS